MLVPNWMIFASVELLAALLILIVILLFRTRGLGRLVSRLQNKVQALVTDLKKTKSEMAEMEAQNTEASYAVLIDEQIELTKEHHESLDPDQNIVLDLVDSDMNSPKHISSLRYAFLLAEKESALSSDTRGPNWDVVQTKLSNIVSFILGGNPPKKQLGDNESADHSTQKIEIDETAEDTLHKHSSTEVVIERDRPINNSELFELRALAESQKQMIEELEARIKVASSDKDKTDLINDLQAQLHTQQRYMQESEMCINQIDDELNAAKEKIQTLEKQQPQDSSRTNNDEINSLRNSIKMLGMENEQLAMQLESSMDNAEAHQLSELKAEHNQLKKKYRAALNQLQKLKSK